jgi:hypothetical protein
VKVFLLHRDRDLDVDPVLRDEAFEAMLSGRLFALTQVRRERERRQIADGAAAAAPSRWDILSRNLELETLWNTMAAGDEFLFETAKRVVLSSLRDSDEIVYRQQVLSDCLDHPESWPFRDGSMAPPDRVAMHDTEGISGERPRSERASSLTPKTTPAGRLWFANMQCYVCAVAQQTAPAVAICKVCSVGLCMEHHAENAQRLGPGGMFSYACLHQTNDLTGGRGLKMPLLDVRGLRESVVRARDLVGPRRRKRRWTVRPGPQEAV